MEMWSMGLVFPKLIARLQKMQNICMRFITYIPRFSHVTPFIRDFRCLKMQERRFVHYVVFLSRLLASGRPSYLCEKITRRSSVHNLCLRHADSTFSIPKHNTACFRSCFSYLSTYIYNNLLSRMNVASPYSLKRNLKDSILSESLVSVDLSLFKFHTLCVVSLVWGCFGSALLVFLYRCVIWIYVFV